MDMNTFIQRAYDANAFTTAQTTAGYINPESWDTNLLGHVNTKLVLAKLGEQFDMRSGMMGDTLHITVGVEPSVATEVAESTASPVDVYEKTQVDFTASEISKTYQLTNKEKVRTFIDLMSDMVKMLGYSLAKKLDSLLVTLLQASAGNAVTADSVASSAIAASNTIDIDDVINAKKEIYKDKLTPYALVVGFEQLADIEKDLAAKNTNLGDVITQNGYVGRFSGLDVYVTTQIAAAANKAKALVLGRDDDGRAAFGVAIKRDPYIETQYFARERYTDIVATMDVGYNVLRANGICTLETYAA